MKLYELVKYVKKDSEEEIHNAGDFGVAFHMEVPDHILLHDFNLRKYWIQRVRQDDGTERGIAAYHFDGKPAAIGFNSCELGGETINFFSLTVATKVRRYIIDKMYGDGFDESVVISKSEQADDEYYVVETSNQLFGNETGTFRGTKVRLPDADNRSASSRKKILVVREDDSEVLMISLDEFHINYNINEGKTK